MALAIFGISNNGLNLVVSLILLMLVVVWLALIVYTYLDARRRIADPFLVGCATIASMIIPYLGTAVYAICARRSSSTTRGSGSLRSGRPSCACDSCAITYAPAARTRSRKTTCAAPAASGG